MKRITTILTFLMLLCMGAWASEVEITVGPATGTYHKGWNSAALQTGDWGAYWRSTAKAPNGTADLLRFNTSTGMNTTNGDIFSTFDYTLEAAAGCFIKSYTINGVAVSQDITITPSGGSGTVVSAGESLETPLSVTVNARSTSFRLSSSTNAQFASLSLVVTIETDVAEAAKSITSGSNYAIYTLSDGTTEGSTPYFLTGTGYLTDNILNAQTFTFTATTQNQYVPAGNAWLVSSGSRRFSNPEKSSRDNMIRTSENNRETYEAQVFYKNASGKYAVRATNTTDATWHANAFWTVDADETGDDIPEADYAVTLDERHYVWYLMPESEFLLKQAKATANNALNCLDDIAVYAEAAEAAKTVVASATTIDAITTEMNSVTNVNVAYLNRERSKYMCTTGTNVRGTTYSADAVWKLTNYNASKGTYKLYNVVHQTYVGQLPSSDNTTTTTTTNSASAGDWTIQNSGAYIIFSMPSVDASHPSLHLADHGGVVRWGPAANASQWEPENVCTLSYGHYKIANAASPSTEGATLFASSTDYYLSGTSVEYTAPIAGLSPVGALNEQPENGEITSDVVVNYYYEQDATLPFTTSTITNGELDNPTWYYMKINTLATYASGDRMVVDGPKTGLHYERWCFVGDAINGVQIFAESKGAAYPVNIASMAKNDNVRISSTSTNTRWFVSGSTLDDLKFYQKSGNNFFYFNQLGGTSDGSGWSWKIGLWDSGSTVVLSPAASAMPAGWAMESINYIPTQSAYTNANTLGWPSSTAKGTLDAAIAAFGMTQSYANYSAMLTAWSNYLATTDIVKPTKGFYRIKSSSSWETAPNKYLIGTNSTKYPRRAAYDGDAGSSAISIWYYDGNTLTNYGNGGYQAISDDNKLSNSSTETTGTDVTFERASGKSEWEAFNIRFNTDRYLHTSATTENDVTYYYTDAGSGVDDTYGYVFSVEPVTELPITVNQVGDKYYATLYMPVPVSISNSTAYTSKEHCRFQSRDPA